MKSILVATDFSKRADPAINRGATLAEMHSAELAIVHIVDDDQSERLADAAQHEAAELFDVLTASIRNEHGVDAKVIVTRGEPHKEILQAADEVAADMIVVGAHRRSIVRNTFIGTTAERSIRSSNLPVLVARQVNNDDYNHPTIALDFSEGDLTPLTTATKMRLFEVETAKIIFAFEAGTYHLLRQSGATDHELNQYFDEEGKTYLPGVTKLLGGTGIEPSQVVLTPIRFNQPDAILEAASNEEADLIVIGTRRKTAFDRFKLGSVSEAILRRADIDVLVIPPA